MTARSTTTDVTEVSKVAADIVLALLATHYHYLQKHNVMDAEQSARHYSMAYTFGAVDLPTGNQYLTREAVQAPSAMEKADISMEGFDTACAGVSRSDLVNCLESLYACRSLYLELHLGKFALTDEDGWLEVSALFEHIAWASIELYPNDIAIYIFLVFNKPGPNPLPVLLRPLYWETKAERPGRAQFWKEHELDHQKWVAFSFEGVLYSPIEHRLQVGLTLDEE